MFKNITKEENVKIAPEGSKWLSQFMDKLPVNCLFDKGITGCGGTELALRNEKHTIIAVPYISLVDNKINQEQHKGKVLGVYGGISKDAIESYIKEHEVKKIMVVYDSLPRLVQTIFEMGIDVFNDYFLLVDEWHVLFNSYVFRNNAVAGLLKLSPSFKEVTYMTATPIEREFLFDEFKDLPIVRVQWSSIKKINITPIQTNIPKKAVQKLINKVLSNEMFGNLHFFVNSVSFILKIVDEMNLTPEQVKIVCSKSNCTSESSGILENGHKLGSPLGDPKKVNFYTSTCFEGCDIYDEQGLTYIVSDANKQTTLLDVRTLVIQICGRIRNARNKNITHIFSRTRYKGTTSLDEFRNKVLADCQRAEKLINKLNSMDEELRIMTTNGFRRNYCTENYISVGDDKRLYLDKNLYNLDIVNFKITTGIYSNRIAFVKELKANDFDVAQANYDYISPSDRLCENSKARVSFEDVFKELVELKKKISIDSGLRFSVIKEARPEVVEAYNILGEERVKELKYHVGNIKAELIKVSDQPKSKLIKSMLMNRLGMHRKRKVCDVIKVIEEVFRELDIKRTVTSTELSRYFETKEIVGKDKDNKSVRTIEILSEKAIHNVLVEPEPALAE
jgi:hypothetical protein